MDYINLSLPKEDAILVVRCLKIAKARKKVESNHHLRKNEIETYKGKFTLIKKITNLSDYVEHLIKQN